MITTLHTIAMDRKRSAMPFFGCDEAVALRALPTIQGEVSLRWTGVFGADRNADLTTAGAPAWSPPT